MKKNQKKVIKAWAVVNAVDEIVMWGGTVLIFFEEDKKYALKYTGEKLNTKVVPCEITLQ